MERETSAEFRPPEKPVCCKAYIGKADYYLARAEDFRRRNGDTFTPGSALYYYILFAYVNAKLFALAHDKSCKKLSTWIGDAMAELQTIIEDICRENPHQFAEYERSPQFAEDMMQKHIGAYMRTRVHELPISSLMHIPFIPAPHTTTTLKSLYSIGAIATLIVTHKTLHNVLALANPTRYN